MIDMYLGFISPYDVIRMIHTMFEFVTLQFPFETYIYI
jgi:hypothetical protein